MTPYLIQRGKFAIKENSKGIDQILKFDYMGSAEFEYGALPKSLNAIRSDVDNFRFHQLIVETKEVTVYCKKGVTVDELIMYLESLAKRENRLKEYSAFDKYIFPKEEDKDYYKTDFWWDIKNHIMFWRKDSEFEGKFEGLIKT